MNDWIDNKIKKVEQKDIESNEQVMELADDIFFDYIQAHPKEESKLVFWNKEENCGNDTEQGRELYDFIRNSLEDKSKVFHKNEDKYFGFVENDYDEEPDYDAKTAQERDDEQHEIYRTLK
jgi:hypothetical protein